MHENVKQSTWLFIGRELSDKQPQAVDTGESDCLRLVDLKGKLKTSSRGGLAVALLLGAARRAGRPLLLSDTPHVFAKACSTLLPGGRDPAHPSRAGTDLLESPGPCAPPPSQGDNNGRRG